MYDRTQIDVPNNKYPQKLCCGNEIAEHRSKNDCKGTDRSQIVRTSRVQQPEALNPSKRTKYKIFEIDYYI